MMELVGKKYYNKLVLGLPTYGRSIKVPEGTDIEKALEGAKTLNLTNSDIVKTWETGVVSFWHQEWYASQPGWQTKHDKHAKQHYLWNPEQSVFMSYDNPKDIKTKVEWLSEKKLGGAMFWVVDDDPMIYPMDVTGHTKGDTREGEKLFNAVLETMKKSSGHKDCEVPARSSQASTSGGCSFC